MKTTCARTNAKHHPHRFGVILLSVLLALSATACGSAPTQEVEASFPSEVVSPSSSMPQSSESGAVVDLRPDTITEGLDARASAADTFGGDVLVNMQTQAQQVNANEVLADTPDDTIMSMSELLIAFAAAKSDFQRHLGSALSQAGLQTSYENEVIRMDPMATADLFVLLAAWEGGPEELLSVWQSATGGEGWTIDASDKDGWLNAVFLRNGTPTAEFVWRWFEGDQYLYGVFNTVQYTMEIDLVRTEYGFAGQLYEPDTPAVYRFFHRRRQLGQRHRL